MIAANFRKHPDAMALQFPLPFGRVLVWALPRPGARILRKIRAERAAAFKAIGRIVDIVKPAIPQWWADLKRAQKTLALDVQTRCLTLT